LARFRVRIAEYASAWASSVAVSTMTSQNGLDKQRVWDWAGVSATHSVGSKCIRLTFHSVVYRTLVRRREVERKEKTLPDSDAPLYSP
jgi:hypothetical protein